jgi:hypothetical protein
VKGNDNVYTQFAATGDWMRSSLSDLEVVINSGVRTVIYDGDADYILNYIGVEAMVRTSSFFTTPSSGPFADLVAVCVGILLKHEVLCRVREPELHDLYG